MVFNRLCDTDSKLGVLRWLQTVSMPQVDVDALTHQHLLGSLDALMDHQKAVDDMVANLLRPKTAAPDIWRRPRDCSEPQGC